MNFMVSNHFNMKFRCEVKKFMSTKRAKLIFISEDWQILKNRYQNRKSRPFCLIKCKKKNST